MSQPSQPTSKAMHRLLLAAGLLLALPMSVRQAYAQDPSKPWIEEVAAPQYFAVLAEDVDRSVAWYRTAFGLPPVVEKSEAEDGSWRIANLRDERLFVEIIRDDRAGEVDRALGFFKVGFFVPDARVVAARIGEATGESPRVIEFERFGVRTIQIHDPDGNTIQLFSPLAAGESVAASEDAGDRAPSFAERRVGFHNGSVELQGTLVLPAGQGRSPAVVFLHGSGPMTREGFRPYAEAFAKLGVASLAFDKRGTGSSGGSWTTSSLDDLAGDALAAIRYLKTEERVDSSRIGFWGISQGGWIAPRAAARSEDVAFMILISGGGVSPRESELYSYGQAFEEAGFSEAESSEGFAVLDDYFRYLASGEGRPALVERLEALDANRDSPLHLLAERLGQVLPSSENRPNWSWVATYDPASDIAKVTCPVLLMFGDQDKEQPTELAVERWREGLGKAGNDDVTLMIFPGAGHGIRMGRHHGGHERPPFADGYREAMLGWLWLHVVGSAP